MIFLVTRNFERVLEIAGLTPLFVTIIAAFLIFNSIWGLVLWHQSAKPSYSRVRASGGERERLRDGTSVSSDDMDEEGPDSARKTNICALPVTIHYVLNILGMLMILALMIAVVSAWGRYNAADPDATPHLVHHERMFRWAFCIVLLLNSIALCFCLYGDLSVTWGHRKGVAWAFITTVCIFMLATGIALVVINTFRRATGVKWIFVGFQATGAILIIAASFGLASACVTPGATLDVLSVTYEFLLIVAFVCAVVFGILGISFHSKMTSHSEIIIAADNILMLFTIILFLTSKKISRAMGQRTLPSGLSIQLLDVRTLTDDQKAQWAAAIDRGNGLRHMGAWDGAGAIEMMKAYSRRGVPDIGGLCLHMYQPTDGRPPTINHVPTAHGPRDDTVALVFVTVVEVIDLTRFVRPLAWLCGRNSLFKWLVVRFGIVGFHWPFTSGVFLVNTNPNRVRRNNAQLLSNSLRAAIEYNNSLPREHQWSLFLLPAMDTELVAHVLEPTKSGFSYATLPPTAIVDLREHRGKTWKEYLRTALRHGNRREYDKQFYEAGGTIHYIRDVYDDNKYSLLNPPEADVFYKNKNPYMDPANYGKSGLVASASQAAIDERRSIMQSANGENKTTTDVVVTISDDAASPTSTGAKGGKKNKNTKGESAEEEKELTAEERAWNAVINAASAGINESKPAQQKKDDKSVPLKSWEVEEGRDDIGSVNEKFESSYPGWTNDFFALWRHIAQHRIEQGHEPTLYDITPQMFADIAKMSPENRYFMLLRLNGQPIGSSVIFRFPRSRMMTCDIQGLEHTQGRKVKAYFIMLNRSVRLALEQGFDFVDFGPTTLGPKTDAGAKLYPCRLGLYATDPALRIVVRLCVSAFANSQSQDEDEATASAARVVIQPPPSLDDVDQTEVPAIQEVVVVNSRSTVEKDAQNRSQETLEELLRMDPASFTGSQRKRFSKFAMKIRRKYKGQFGITERSNAAEVGKAILAAMESGLITIQQLEGDEGGAQGGADKKDAGDDEEKKEEKKQKKKEGGAQKDGDAQKQGGGKKGNQQQPSASQPAVARLPETETAQAESSLAPSSTAASTAEESDPLLAAIAEAVSGSSDETNKASNE